MSEHITCQDKLPDEIRHLAAVDVSYTKEDSISAAVLLDYASLSPVESETARVKTVFPYIPTLLSFRELPPALTVIRKLRIRPDVILVDGHGIMHPYRLGFASHLGLVLNIPTIGVAKSPLIGEAGQFNKEKWAPMIAEGEIVGALLKTGRKTKPVYVSIGHMVSLKSAIKIVKRCTPNYRIPKPIRLAHNLSTQAKRKPKIES
jgi:deoxyribonuclease V